MFSIPCLSNQVNDKDQGIKYLHQKPETLNNLVTSFVDRGKITTLARPGVV